MKLFQIIKAVTTNSIGHRLIQWLATLLSLAVLIWRSYFPIHNYFEHDSVANPPGWLVFATWPAVIWLGFVYVSYLWRKAKEGYQTTV